MRSYSIPISISLLLLLHISDIWINNTLVSLTGYLLFVVVLWLINKTTNVLLISLTAALAAISGNYLGALNADKYWPSPELLFILGGILGTSLLIWFFSKSQQKALSFQNAYRPIFFRRIILVALPSFLGGLFILSLLYLINTINNKDRFISELKEDVLDVKASVEASLSELHSDVIYLSRIGSSFVSEDGILDTKTMTDVFVHLSETMQLYDQLRILDTSGMELLRVNYHQGKAIRVPDEELQDKSGRDYFQNSKDLTGDQVYVSQVSLNEEKGKIERPYKPVMRAISPLYAPNGKKFAYVAINYLPSPLFNRFALSGNKDFHYLFLDNYGNILAGAKPHELYGFSLEEAKKFSFNKTHPDVWATTRGDQDYFVNEDESFIWSKIFLSNIIEDDYNNHVRLHESSIPEINLAGIIPNDVIWWESHRHLSLYFISLILFTLFFAVILTIANKKQLIAYLERAKFEGVFNKSFQFIGLLDPMGAVVEFNETALAFSQCPREEVIGRKFWELPWWKKDGSSVQQIHDVVHQAQDGISTRFETEVQNSEGTIRVDLSIRPIFDANGAVQFLLPELRDISELLSMQETLRETNIILEDIQQKAGIGVWRLDVDDNSMFWSKQVYQILEVPLDSTISFTESLQKLFPDDRTEFLKCMEDLKNGSIGFDRELRIIASNGSPRWVRITGNPVLENNVLKEVRGVFMDINESKRQQLEFADMAHRLILATQAAQIGIWEWDAEKQKMYWDKTMYHIHDVSPGDFHVSYENWLPLIHPDDLAYFSSVFESGDPQINEFSMSYAIRTPNGETRYIQALGNVEFNKEGKLIRVIGVNLDVTIEKTAQEQIRQLNRNLEQKVEERTRSLRKTTIELEQQLSLLDSSTIVSITDKNGNITHVNSTFCEISGYTREELIGQNHRILKSGKQPEGLFVGMWAALKAGKTWNGEICNKRKDGSYYWVKTIIAPFFDENGEIDRFVSARFDISALKEAEQRLRWKAKELASINKRLDLTNQELEAFSYSVSHDLKAPLRALQGFSNNLIKAYGDKMDETGNRWLNYISDNAAQMDQLIQDILHFSRVGKKELSKTSVDMNAIVDRVMEREQAGTEKKIETEIDKLPAGFCDPSLIELVWQNLIGNAVKYSGNNEVIHIKISGTETEEGCQYDIKDNGVGFDMNYVDKIFGLFQRLHDRTEFEGTGVGLATVLRILQKHGGSIKAQSAPGKGAHFTFILPKSSQLSEL